MNTNLQTQVYEALSNAADNGFCFYEMSFLEIAEDLITNDSDLKDQLAEDLIPHIKAFFHR